MKKLLALFLLSMLTYTEVFASGHTVTITSTNVLCNGQCTGTATATVSGGVGPFSYTWSSASTSSNLNGLCIGNYTVTVTDNNDLSVATTNVYISEPNKISITVITSASACNQANGSAIANAIGGTGALSYSWNFGATGQTQTGLSSGSYKVYVSDSNNCTNTDSLVFVPITIGYLAWATTQTSCVGSADGTAHFSLNQDTAGFKFNWSNG
ncbi:MAG: hypothetical protein JNL63_08670, partial [Bacteroidia bacterium]|nr:hypothetical protein [Bacteroidia bacterium]